MVAPLSYVKAPCISLICTFPYQSLSAINSMMPGAYKSEQLVQDNTKSPTDQDGNEEKILSMMNGGLINKTQGISLWDLQILSTGRLLTPSSSIKESARFALIFLRFPTYRFHKLWMTPCCHGNGIPLAHCATCNSLCSIHNILYHSLYKSNMNIGK